MCGGLLHRSEVVKRQALLIVLMLGSVGLGARAYAQDDPTTPSWCVSVWYPSSEHAGGYESLMRHAEALDEVNPFWYSALPDGTLALSPEAEDAEKLAAWREAGLLILPTIANAAPQAVHAETRAAHIANIVALVERMNYDGIDIDYEAFPLATRDDFSAFIEALGTELHARGRLLSIAVHAKTSDAGAWEGAAAQDWTRLASAVDVFRIMTYDYHNRASATPGPIGPPQWAAEVLRYAASVTELGKVRLGLHFYGYRWQRSSVATVTWESFQRTVASFDLTIARDPADREAYVQFKARGLPAQTIYVADAVGLAYKLDALQAAYPELGGVAIWGVGGEDPALWDVLQTHRMGDCALRRKE